MVERLYCQDMVEKSQASLFQYCNELACRQGTGSIVSTSSSPKFGRDSLPGYALSVGLAARLWVKPCPGVVADSKERRGRALPRYASKFAILWVKSHNSLRIHWRCMWRQIEAMLSVQKGYVRSFPPDVCTVSAIGQGVGGVAHLYCAQPALDPELR